MGVVFLIVLAAQILLCPGLQMVLADDGVDEDARIAVTAGTDSSPPVLLAQESNKTDSEMAVPADKEDDRAIVRATTATHRDPIVLSAKKYSDRHLRPMRLMARFLSSMHNDETVDFYPLEFVSP